MTTLSFFFRFVLCFVSFLFRFANYHKSKYHIREIKMNSPSRCHVLNLKIFRRTEGARPRVKCTKQLGEASGVIMAIANNCSFSLQFFCRIKASICCHLVRTSALNVDMSHCTTPTCISLGRNPTEVHFIV